MYSKSSKTSSRASLIKSFNPISNCSNKSSLYSETPWKMDRENFVSRWLFFSTASGNIKNVFSWFLFSALNLSSCLMNSLAIFMCEELNCWNSNCHVIWLTTSSHL
ncbi:hypothetical protein D3C85_1001420 [compost metagenome]